MKYYFDAFKKYADFSGRATRTEYWMFVLCNMIAAIIIGFIAPLVFSGIIGNGVGFVYVLATLIPSLALWVRRLHDTGRSGWWILLILIPFIGAIVLFIFSVLDSTPDNSYGPNPKGIPTPSAVPQ